MIKAKIRIRATYEFEGTFEAENLDIAIHDAITEAATVGEVVDRKIDILEAETI